MARHLRALAVTLLVGAAPAFAQVEVKVVMPLLLKMLTYDLNFDARGVGPFVVLVVGTPGQANQRQALVAELSQLPAHKVKKRPVSYVGVDFVSEGQLQAEIDRLRPAAILAAPGLPLPIVKEVWEVTQDNQLYGLALEASLVEAVLPFGVALNGDKPQVVINEKASKAVGVRFEASMLKLARVIQ